MNEKLQKEKKETYSFGAILAIGVSFGMILGMMLENIGMGMSLGLGLATLVNAIKELREGEPGAGTAVIITAAAVILVLGIWIWIG